MSSAPGGCRQRTAAIGAALRTPSPWSQTCDQAIRWFIWCVCVWRGWVDNYLVHAWERSRTSAPRAIEHSLRSCGSTLARQPRRQPLVRRRRRRVLSPVGRSRSRRGLWPCPTRLPTMAGYVTESVRTRKNSAQGNSHPSRIVRSFVRSFVVRRSFVRAGEDFRKSAGSTF